MPLIDPSGAREFLETLIAGFSVLGGVMAYYAATPPIAPSLAMSRLPSLPTASTRESGRDSKRASQRRSWLL
jgi:hypothetical protein